jgi:protein O-mannosyl-transferase
VLAALAAYANAVPASFQFDDYNVIVDNPAVHGLAAWWASMPGIRPLLKLSYALNWAAGPGPFGFHLVNLACHALNTLMVYLLALLWLPRLAPDLRPVVPAACTAALVFGLHPAQTEAVTYVAGRSLSLMSCFYLAALLAAAGPALRNRLLSAALFALALGVRETAWTLPFALVLLRLAQPGSAPAPVRWSVRLRAATQANALHWLVLAAALAAALATPGYRRLMAASIDARTLEHNLLTQVDGLWYLVTHPLLTLRTNIDPDIAVRTILAPDLAARAAVLGLAVAVALRQLRRRPWLAFGTLWFFLHLLPTNSILPRLDPANDRHLYLAMLGPALVIAAVLWKVTGRRAASAVAFAGALLLATATVARNRDYRTEVSLWEATAAASASKARVWNNLGYAHAVAGNRAQAQAAYQRALGLDPGLVKARYNLEALRRTLP